MNREASEYELVDLGAASVETKGSLTSMDDEEGGWKPHAGLCAD